MKRLEIFDFDGTLISADSLWLMMRSTHSLYSIAFALLRCAPRILLAKMHLAGSSGAKEQLLRTLYGGWPREKFAIAAAALLPRLQKAELKEYVTAFDCAVADKDCTVVIASASLREWVEPWASLHKADYLIATEFDTLSGNYIGRNCRGKEKARRVRELINRLGNDFNQIQIHTDTPRGADAPLLSLTKTQYAIPIAINNLKNQINQP